jgi:hypothetical protein
MIVLSANQTLTATLSTAPVTSNLVSSISYSDTGGALPGESSVTVGGNTAVTIVTAPAASVSRIVNSINIYNPDTASASVTIAKSSNGSSYTLTKTQLQPGYTLAYNSDGWYVTDTNGSLQNNFSGQLSQQSFKNRVLNGTLRWWQRGVGPLSGNSINQYLADKFKCFASGSTGTFSQQLFAVGQTAVPGNPVSWLRMVSSSVTGASSAVCVSYFSEDMTEFAGKTMTLSFWAKADTARTIAVEFGQYPGSGGSAAVTGLGVTHLALTSSWALYTVTYTFPSISGLTFSGSQLTSSTITWWLDAGSNFNTRSGSLGQQSGTVDLAMIQWEQGSVATTFDQRPEGVELSSLQRYYEKSYDPDTAPGTVTTFGYIQESMNSLANTVAHTLNSKINFKAVKRVAPTVSIYSWQTGTSAKVYDAIAGADTTYTMGSNSPGTINCTIGLTSVNTNVSQINFVYQWAADADF